jgi:hypothetical protein
MLLGKYELNPVQLSLEVTVTVIFSSINIPDCVAQYPVVALAVAVYVSDLNIPGGSLAHHDGLKRKEEELSPEPSGWHQEFTLCYRLID